MDTDGDNLISGTEAVTVVRKQDDMDAKEIYNLFNLADQVLKQEFVIVKK